MKLLAAFLLPLVLAGQPAAHELDLALPGAKEPLRLRIAVSGGAAEATWAEFLDRWFDWFDRDGDGALSRAEAERIFPLPLADGRTVAFDFGQADSDRSGSVSRAELKDFYRRRGFAPAQTVVVPPSADDLRLADAMFRHLRGAEGGRLTRQDLERAEKLLRKLDDNDDEVLTPAEVLSLGLPAQKPLPRGNFQLLPPKDKTAPGGLRVSVGQGGEVGAAAFGVGTVLLKSPDQFARARTAEAVLTFSSGQDDPAKSIATMRRFVVSQFKIAAGARGWLDQQQVAGDASLQVVADVFPHANRKGDGKLTSLELDQFLDLIEKGVTCVLVVTLTDRGRNLFHLLDTDGDGRLGGAELFAAAKLLTDLDGRDGWTREQVPHAVRITVQQGFAGGSFGPLPLVASRKAAPEAARRVKRGPAWFQAMDRNGDGFVSRGEFLGSAEQFRQLDLDGDGRISVAEAEQAEKKK